MTPIGGYESKPSPPRMEPIDEAGHKGDLFLDNCHFHMNYLVRGVYSSNLDDARVLEYSNTPIRVLVIVE